MSGQAGSPCSLSERSGFFGYIDLTLGGKQQHQLPSDSFCNWWTWICHKCMIHIIYNISVIETIGVNHTTQNVFHLIECTFSSGFGCTSYTRLAVGGSFSPPRKARFQRVTSCIFWAAWACSFWITSSASRDIPRVVSMVVKSTGCSP